MAPQQDRRHLPSQTEVRCAWPVSQPRPSPATQDTNRGGGGRWTRIPIPNPQHALRPDRRRPWNAHGRCFTCLLLRRNRNRNRNRAHRLCPAASPPALHPAYRLSGTQPGQRQPVRRDSQDGGNPPGPGRFACVPCLSWLAGGGGMCSHPGKKKKRCCNVPLMRPAPGSDGRMAGKG